MWPSFFNTFLFALSLGATSAGSGAGDVEVITDLGKIRGTQLKSRLGVTFNAFRGIRYAESPIGELRFKNPKPVDPWKPKAFDATDDGPMCPQRTLNESDASEDCLRLNVYTKDLSHNARKPVIVYIHPGGFYAVSGQSKNFAGPHIMMDRDIVFVTINYRLGSLGFLATGNAHAPGNAGLKDQVIALRWIQSHIRKFGGDPDSVTLLGYSAGSFSIGLHMISPMAAGLFHRGIMMSASPVSQWRYEKNQLRLAEKQARLVNCPQTPTDRMIKCLREIPAVDYMNTMQDMFEFGWSPVLLWTPVIEDDFGQERFLTEDPLKSLQMGKFQKIPIISGITKDEFASAAHATLKNETLRKLFNEDFEKYAPICFLYERDTPRSKEISAVLRSEYLQNKTLKFPESIDPLGQIFSDSLIGFAVYRFVHLVARSVPVYYYRFSVQGRYSHLYYPDNKPYGVVHHDDLLYLLTGIMTPMFTPKDPEVKTVERLTRMWTQFAKTGDPNKPSDEYLREVRWKPFSFRRENYLDIGENLVMKEGLYLERFQLWKRLFPLSWNERNSKKGDKINSDYEDEPECCKSSN